MSTIASVLRALIKQGRINSQLFSALGILAANNNLGKNGDKFIELLTAAIENNNELVEALDEAVENMGEIDNG